MKKLLLTAMVAALLVCSLVMMVNAQAAYLEEIPSHLKVTNDTAEYFIVFDGAEYYKGNGSTINSLNREAIAEAIGESGLNLDASQIGKKYLPKYVFPAEFNGTVLTSVDFNTSSLKNDKDYFRGKCGAIVLPGTVKTVSDMNDCVGQLRYIDFGENSQLAAIPGHFCNAGFKLKQIDNFPTNLTGGIGAYAFANCRSAFRGELYLNASTIANKAFDNCFANVTGLIIGELVNKIENESLSGLEAGKIGIKYIEFQCDLTKLTICESIKMRGAFYFGTTDSQRSPLDELACIILSNPAQVDCDGKTFQDYFPKVYFSEKSMTEGDFVYSAHDYGSTKVEYKDFFTESKMKSECSLCGCVNEGALVDPIIKILGYSKSEIGGGAIVFGMKIDYNALNLYNESVSNDKKITALGLLAANVNLVGSKAFDEELNAKKGCLFADLLLVEKQNEYAEIKVSGITGENYDYTDIELFITAYAFVGGEAVYFDNGTDSKELLTSVTYNTVK